ncbi:TMEM165/GDT1 family protein [Andreprevotia chitinilytica]|uniref:TMEM165/GDT1 family protein n=1 Tax=Andreprevotia chitinilytica TaxID=396808 RepID=UPI00054E2F9C|nr:TMEM165/GDT1 family protein [Andreprevotia chitinilytica]
MSFDAFLVSTGVVAVAEMGDKTQLLALMLAARFRQPLPVVAGILAATILNHLAAGWVGTLLAGIITPEWLRWIVGISFLATAVWALIPDKMEEGEAVVKPYGAFLTTAIAFFIAELGDKTQIATVTLAVKYSPLWQVVLGTTTGMLIADVPAVWLGKWVASHMNWLRAVRFVAAFVFAVLGVMALLGIGAH